MLFAVESLLSSMLHFWSKQFVNWVRLYQLQNVDRKQQKKSYHFVKTRKFKFACFIGRILWMFSFQSDTPLPTIENDSALDRNHFVSRRIVQSLLLKVMQCRLFMRKGWILLKLNSKTPTITAWLQRQNRGSVKRQNNCKVLTAKRGNSLFFPQQRMLWSSGFCFCKRSMSMTS